MGKVNPLTFTFHIKQDDLYPPIRIKIYNVCDSVYVDLTGYVGTFYMAPISDKSTPKVNAGTVSITDAENGEAEYIWQIGDTDTPGQYYYEFRFTKDSKTFTVPVISPGIIYIETKIGV